MSETIWHLKRCHLFERLAAAETARLESRSLIRTFQRRSPIFLPGDRADDVLLLASGRVKICSLTDEGKQAILAFIEPGELFGELAVIGLATREDFCEATEKSTVVLIPREEMLRLMESHPEVSLGVTRLMGLRRRRIERRLKHLLFQSNRQRLVHLLLELVEQYGLTTAEGIELRIKLSHQDLADVIGSTRETVTVVLGELQAEGLLTIGRRRIVIRRLEVLAADVSQSPPVVAPPNPTLIRSACGGSP